jgi:putative transposase
VSDDLPVEVACRVVGVSVSGYYAQRRRSPSARAVRHAMLADVITPVHSASRQTYGARRVHAELTLGRDLTVARCTVELIMRRLQLAGLPGRPRYRKIPKTPTASDLVNRDFGRTEPNRLWLTDITEHRTFEGKVYCAVVLDAFSRRVVGWSIDSSQTSNLVVHALGMAIENRQAEGVVIHSDHGTQGFRPIHIVGVHAPSAGLGAGAVDGLDRRLLRQRDDGVVLGSDAGRAVEPSPMADPPRARQRDLRIP